MKWKNASKNNEGLFKIPKRWLHVHYYEALNLLFRFENSLRVFVYTILKNEIGKDWTDCMLAVGENDPQKIKAIAAKRIKQADSFGYIGFDIKAPLMHLTSGEIVELITSDSYWPKFREYFRGSKEIMKNKLLEIGTIRNSLAHFRPVKSEDLEVIKHNSRHTLLGVEECLENVFFQNLRVPTNTLEPWFSALSTLGTPHLATVPYYSANERWVNIKLSFKTPILSKRKARIFVDFNLCKINTPNILRSHCSLTNALTYLSESVNSPTLTEEDDLEVTKDLNFVFRKDVLELKYQSIATELTNLLSKINEECDLLRQDNLARGSIVEVVRTYSYLSTENQESAKWEHYISELKQPYQSNDPDEYWGEHQFASGWDIIAGCVRYPWMPGNISQIEDMEEFFEEK